jgi:hypothetical protein
MKSIVVYYSKTGNTKDVADLIAKGLECKVFPVNLMDKKNRGTKEERNTEKELYNNAIQKSVNCDLAVIGTPTGFQRAKSMIQRFVRDVQADAVALFCTYDNKIGTTLTDLEDALTRARIWIDMVDDYWRAIHITRDGWRVVVNPPTMFRRFTHQQPLPKPVRGGDVRELLEFTNLPNPNHQLLYLVDTATKFIPGIPHPIGYYYGCHGSGKTIGMIAQRAVIDPSIVKLLKLPKNDRELVQQLFHHYLGFYDNVSTLPKWMSDTFCRAVTGTGNTKRQLYTDDDIIYQYRRCPGLNGINIVAVRGDFLDRTIFYECGMIDDKDRIEDKVMERRLREKTPRILGAILDALVKALNIFPTVELDGLTRMADFHRWGYAIAEAMDIGGEAFLEAYKENVESQSEETLKASIIAHVLLTFMMGRDEWSGTPTALLNNLNEVAETMNISTRVKDWPKRAHILTRRLNELAPSLMKAEGLCFDRHDTGKARQIRIYIVGKTPESSVSSVIAYTPTTLSDASDA